MSLKTEHVVRCKRFIHLVGGLWAVFLGIIMIGAGVNSVLFPIP